MESLFSSKYLLGWFLFALISVIVIIGTHSLVTLIQKDNALIKAKLHYGSLIYRAIYPVTTELSSFDFLLLGLKETMMAVDSMEELNNLICSFHRVYITPSAEHADARVLFNEILEWHQYHKNNP
jgi:hypothetical protein